MNNTSPMRLPGYCIDRRETFVVPPLGGMKLLPAKAGTTNLNRPSCNFLLRVGLVLAANRFARTQLNHAFTQLNHSPWNASQQACDVAK